ncbi:hypothetical protein [Enterococcus mundtii]|uniref:hypothetical protein n=1 Tax=Enterococcus mundtii TaxID=53346 RepID=UPI000DFD14DE|nr:hypothetical protein [Enterococcus mundtii]STD24510.1 Uncharacterised protein [Enterococcus mundtii]
METNIELKGELGIVDSRPPTEESKPPPGESQPSTEESSSSEERTSTTDSTRTDEQLEQINDTNTAIGTDIQGSTQIPIKVETQTIDYFPKTNEQSEPLVVTWVGIFLVFAVISYRIIDRKMNK